MSIYLYPLAAAVGGLVGTIVHEATHAVAAHALGELRGVGWQGGLAGGPYVDYHTPSRWRSEVIRKLPLALGVAAAIVLALAYDGVTVAWLTAAGAVAGLLWASPEDLFLDAAEQSAE